MGASEPPHPQLVTEVFPTNLTSMVAARTSPVSRGLFCRLASAGLQVYASFQRPISPRNSARWPHRQSVTRNCGYRRPAESPPRHILTNRRLKNGDSNDGHGTEYQN